MKTSIRWTVKRIARAALETIYPKTCAGCGMRGMWLCDLCEGTVPSLFGASLCARCGVPRWQNRCTCRDLLPMIRRARAAYPYDGWVASAVRRMKYDGEPSRVEQLGALLVPLLPAFGRLDGIVPVPLHPSRQRDRGYNQAALLAAFLADASGAPVMPLLKRTTRTVSQVSLTGRERKHNVAGAFALDRTWQPRPGGRYLLVDDVRTTSSTLNACAEALASIRPAMVCVITVAVDLPAEHVTHIRRMASAASTPNVAP